MIKKILPLFMVCFILVIPSVLTSCSKDEDKDLVYEKVTDWDATPREILSNEAILKCTGGRQDWGIYFTTDETKLSDFKYINQLEFDDWQKFEESGVEVRMVYGATNFECVLDGLFPNTTYYYIAFFYVHSSPGEYVGVKYTDIQSFTTKAEDSLK